MDSPNSRTSSAQGLFEAEMARAYSPNSPIPRKQWDPVLRTWRQSKAVQLFPPQHASKADAIFGEGAANDIYSPHNGLFLHEKVEHALKKGYIAIVPDGRLDGILGYKVVVLDKQRREVHRRIGRFEVDGFGRYIDLDERRLHFKTSSRPKVGYVWWTYVSAVLQTFYWADSPSDYGNINHLSEVRWLDSYWKYHGPFVKRNQLNWFVNPNNGPRWTAAYLHGFEEEGDMPNSGLDIQRIFRNEYRERQQSPVPDYEEVDSGDDEATGGRGQNGEGSSRIDNTALSATAIAYQQRSAASLRASPPSSASIYPSRTFVPPPPYSSDTPPAYSSQPPPPLPPLARHGQQVGTHRPMLTWRGISGNDTKKTMTVTTITTTRTSGDRTTTRREVIETATTVSGDDEDTDEQASGRDNAAGSSMPRFRSGELVPSKLADLTRFRLDPRAGRQHMHPSQEMERVYGDSTDAMLWWRSGSSSENGNERATSTTLVAVKTTTDGTTARTQVVEDMTTTVTTVTDGDNDRDNGRGNHNETVHETIDTITITTNGNNGR